MIKKTEQKIPPPLARAPPTGGNDKQIKKIKLDIQQEQINKKIIKKPIKKPIKKSIYKKSSNLKQYLNHIYDKNKLLQQFYDNYVYILVPTNTITKHTSFNNPITIIVQKKYTNDPNIFENFKLPTTYRYQNRIHRVNHIKTPTRAISNKYFNNSSKLINQHKIHQLNKIKNNNYYSGNWGSSYPYYYIGSYGYFPFNYYYNYDYTNVLPFDLNTALLPLYDPYLNYPTNTNIPILQSIVKEKVIPVKTKVKEVKTKVKEVKEVKTKEVKTNEVKTKGVILKEVILKKDKIKENFNDINNNIKNDIPTPEGYRLITIRLVEVDELPQRDTEYDLIFILLLMCIILYIIRRLKNHHL